MELLNIDDLDLEHIDQISEIELHNSDPEPFDDSIAIIGISGKIGKAENVSEFWEAIKSGEDFYRTLSDERKKDADRYGEIRGIKTGDHYIEGTLLKNISNFDHDFFGLSMQEAKCMDPNQRLLLENTWKALEDAGYAGERLKGTHTGVFVGHSSDFGMNYRTMIHNISPEINELAVSGNVASMIASRISYQFDLDGPAMMIDTACSSGLMAVYEACQSIKKNECDMAIAGAVKCAVYPVWYDKKDSDGVRIISDTQSKDNITNTYDENASGTFLSEGVVTFILKPLSRAKTDKDHIYAVILGGSRNQDGRSNGITAPNLKAQKDMLLRAWEDAGISPEQLKYIENHGTATKLGDPIEIRAISEALKKFTKKKQICGVGSVKTNIGHMDHASGMAGLLKLVLSLENGEIPKSIHFRQPNSNIDFIDMPLYVVDSNVPIKDRNETLVGINSFGISGTNCHLVLRGYEDTDKQVGEAKELGEFIVPISAKNKETLKILVEKYVDYLENEQVEMQDFLRTVIVGRKHFSCRLCIVASSKEQLIDAMKSFISGNDEYVTKDAYLSYREHKIVAGNPHTDGKVSEITAKEKEELSRKQHKYLSLGQFGENLSTWMKAYVGGADIPWKSYVDQLGGKIVSLSTYPFTPTRCWLDEKGTAKKNTDRQVIHTMFMDIVIEQCDIENCWELREHTLNNYSILPGTALIDKMLTYIREEYGYDRRVVLENVQFEAPFGVAKDEQKELQMTVKKENDRFLIGLYSQVEDDWDVHATAEYRSSDYEAEASTRCNIADWKKRVPAEIVHEDKKDSERGIKVSDRWSKSLRKCHSTENRDEFLFELKLADQYKDEALQHRMHPALFDIAVNAVSGCIGEDQTFLPFSYGRIVSYKDLTAHIFVYAKKRKGDKGSELYSFDLTISDNEGNKIAEIENYSIKRLPKEDFSLHRKVPVLKEEYFCVGDVANSGSLKGRLLYLGSKDSNMLKGLNANKELEIDLIDPVQADIAEQLSKYQGQKYELGIYDASVYAKDELYAPVQKCVDFLKAVTLKKMEFRNGICIVSSSGSKVTDKDNTINPAQAAVMGAAGVIGNENEKLKIRCLDLDEHAFADFSKFDISKYNLDVIFVREDKVYSRKFDEAHEEKTSEEHEHSGVVIVSGGMGQIGNLVCKWLRQKGFSNVLAIGHQGRTEMNGFSDGIEALEVNVENIDEVEEAVRHAKEKYGNIEGVIHMAGKAGDGFALLKDEKDFFKVYAGKAIGAYNLYQSTKDENLKFMIMFSSVASLARDPGQADYTAANMFLDALAEKAHLEGRSCVSVLWPPFDKVGMAHYMNAIGKNKDFSEIQVEEAVDILERIITGQIGDTAVILPNKRKSRKVDRAEQDELKDITIIGTSEEDEVIRNVAKIWCRTLDINVLDVNDEFIKLGGNSLLSTVMLKEYQRIYPDVMEIADLFSYTTANKQAEYVREKLGITKQSKEPDKKLKEDTVTDLLDAVINGSMSVEESLRLL